ncbi:MAG: hypothetical protein IIV96_05200, partial [Ruminococcus sp.]|nr:hypothetical protein [Ruminococcus sp.]
LSDLQEMHEKEKQLYVEKEAFAQAKEVLLEAQKKHEEYVMNQDRLKKMVQIYGVKSAESLYETIKERAFEHRVAIAGLEKEIVKINRHLDQVREGRILEESAAVAKVKDYLESRHGDFALSGVDYLSALPKSNREELLQRFPMLPYGVVTKQFELVKEDERIGTIDLENQAVPIFNQNTLESPYVPVEEEGVILIAKDKSSFLEEDALAMEATRLEKKLSDLQEELVRFREMEALVRAFLVDHDAHHRHQNQHTERHQNQLLPLYPVSDLKELVDQQGRVGDEHDVRQRLVYYQ